MDVRRLFRFRTKVVAATFRNDANVWDVELDSGEVVSCRFVISATGPLSATRMPDIEGIDAFAGESYHSSRWPVDANGNARTADFSGKRVGIIGTGATGVQIIPIVAETAKDLTVFQRTPNWCTPLGNVPITPAEMEAIRKRYPTILEYVKSTDTAFPYHRDPRKAVSVPKDERDAFFEHLYNQPGYGIWLSGFRDLLLNKESNQFLADFVADKIRQRVNDPRVAEKLIPKDHPFGGKRVPMETNYYETFNLETVNLVDIKESPIVRITEKGIQTADAHYDLDVIIFATGFDAVTGALDRIDIKGEQGACAQGELGRWTLDFPRPAIARLSELLHARGTAQWLDLLQRRRLRGFAGRMGHTDALLHEVPWLDLFQSDRCGGRTMDGRDLSRFRPDLCSPRPMPGG
jgi:cation diffusion facilitator CzcD-associated flavoprotein CzcO